ncbi:MAG: hypothetical protein IIX61_05300, partial [Loktanella sp.]|nr:hypothetical protein [Loktanella sp.]
MSDLLNIGRSGLLAYRTALGVVGENIANVDTKGYLRRDAQLAETRFGGGVDVADISRAFDALLVTRNRDAISNLAAAQTQLTHLRDLEDRLLPGVQGVQLLLDGFFDALDGLALAPADTGLRAAALSAGQTLAGGVADLALGLDRLSSGIAAETREALTRSNTLLQMLGTVQAQMVQTDKTGAQNGLLDQRDRLLDDLAGLVQIDVSFDARGLASLRLGAGGGGPLLLRGVDYGRLEQTATGQIRAMTADQGQPVALPTLAGGVLGGLLAAQGSVGQGVRDLDVWAGQMVSQMNAAHQRGIAQDGQPGRDLFSMSGWSQSRGALIRSDAVADITLRDASVAPAGPLTLVFAAETASWQLRDAAGETLASGNPEITHAGLQITLRGTPRDGDRITLTRIDGAARHLQMALSDPRQIAAAGPLVAGADARNQGTGTIAVRLVDAPVSGQVNLTQMLSATGTEFLSAGVVGVLPAGSGMVDLSVQPRLRSFEVALPAGATA